MWINSQFNHTITFELIRWSIDIIWFWFYFYEANIRKWKKTTYTHLFKTLVGVFFFNFISCLLLLGMYFVLRIPFGTWFDVMHFYKRGRLSVAVCFFFYCVFHLIRLCCYACTICFAVLLERRAPRAGFFYTVGGQVNEMMFLLDASSSSSSWVYFWICARIGLKWRPFRMINAHNLIWYGFFFHSIWMLRTWWEAFFWSVCLIFPLKI